MDHGKYPIDETIREVRETLSMLVNLADKMRGCLAKYESKYNLEYGPTAPEDIFNRMCLLVEYLDKKLSAQQ